MRKNLWALAALVFILSLVLAACGGGPGAAGKDPAAAAVESFLAAAVTKDSAKVSSLVLQGLGIAGPALYGWLSGRHRRAV